LDFNRAVYEARYFDEEGREVLAHWPAAAVSAVIWWSPNSTK
jgi:hypothetical protein